MRINTKADKTNLKNKKLRTDIKNQEPDRIPDFFM